MPWYTPSFSTTAFSLSAATGSSSSTTTATFTNQSGGLIAAASALAVGSALSPTGTPKPAASAFVDVSVPIASMMIGNAMNISVNAGGFAFQAASLEVSSLNLLDPYSSVNAPFA